LERKAETVGLGPSRRSAPERATVIARWSSDRGLLQTDRGAVFSVTVPESTRDAFDVGVAAWIVYDVLGRMTRWFIDDGRATPVANEVLGRP
jgi:hypothetical protein